MNPQAFIDQLVAPAQACQRATGIPASFTIAQAALESSWGARAPGYNLFGIKADKAWTGPVTEFATHEVVNGVSVPIVDRFRCYRTWGECLADRADFFRKNPRYANCFKDTTGHGWAHDVAQDHYATDPNYADKLIAIMDGHNLTRFDTLPAPAA